MIQKSKSIVEISIEFIFRHAIRSTCNSVYTHILRVHITCQDDGVVVCTKAHLPLLCCTLRKNYKIFFLDFVVLKNLEKVS